MAAELAMKENKKRSQASLKIKRMFLEKLKDVDHQINGDPGRSQSHILNIRFCGVDGEALMLALQETLAFSNGSACTSSLYEPSHVLKAMGLDDQRIAESVRFSWDHNTKSFPFELMINVAQKIKM